MYSKRLSFAVILGGCLSLTAALAIDKPPSQLLSPDEPGQAEYRAALRESIYTAIDALLFSPLPAEIDVNLAQDYRNVQKQQQWSKELMYGVIENLRTNLPQGEAVEQQKAEMFRAVDQGSEQFSNVLYKTLAAVNAAEVALAAPTAGIRRALERRGYIVIDEATAFRSLENGTGNGTLNGTAEGKGTWWPTLQTAGNVVDLTKCVKDSISGHYDHINVFEIVPVIGPMLTRMPGASIVLDMLDSKVKGFKRIGYALTCIKELRDDHWGPNDDEILAQEGAVGVASALCSAIQSADGAVKGAANLAHQGLKTADKMTDKAIGAVPVIGETVVDIKHGFQNAAGTAVIAGVNATYAVLDGAKKAARGALGMVFLG